MILYTLVYHTIPFQSIVLIIQFLSVIIYKAKRKELNMSCTNCPRSCNIIRENGQTGFCSAGNKAKVARYAPHLWEEGCICGEKGSGTVFFSGCNLKCIYCQNVKIRDGRVGKEYTDRELCDIYLYLQELGVSNINLVTPTPYIDNIINSLDMAWENGLYIPTVYNCGGYESVSGLKRLRGYVGVYLTDFKYLCPQMSKELSGAPDYPEVAKKALYEMVNQRSSPVYRQDGIMTKGVIVRHLVLPSYIEQSVNVIDYLHREYGDSIVLSIMSQYTPMPNMKGELSRRLKADEYKKVIDYAESIGVKNAYVQDGDSASESFIPEFR